MKSRLAARLQGDLHVAMCPSRSVLDHVTSRWGALVLLLLQEGTHRFGELRRAIGGVSEKMLAQSLALLEADGFVERRAYAEVPPRVEYSLTPMGREVASHLAALADWIEDNTARVLSARTQATPGASREGGDAHARAGAGGDRAGTAARARRRPTRATRPRSP